MELHGGNGAFGGERVELSEKRWVLPLETEAPVFPLGVGGLLPVVTVRKDGSEKTVHAFPCDDGDVDEMADALALHPALAALVDAVAFVNKMLVQAATLSGYPFGTLGGIETGVSVSGWGFTRVDVVPLDAHGQPSASPLHLHIETTDEPGCPGSFNAVIEYDAEGNPAHLVMTEYDEEDMFTVRVDANVNEKTGKFSVRKVERINRYTRNKSLFYKRGQQPKVDERGRGGRSGGRGGNGGGRSGGRERWDRHDRSGGSGERRGGDAGNGRKGWQRRGERGPSGGCGNPRGGRDRW